MSSDRKSTCDPSIINYVSLHTIFSIKKINSNPKNSNQHPVGLSLSFFFALLILVLKLGRIPGEVAVNNKAKKI